MYHTGNQTLWRRFSALLPAHSATFASEGLTEDYVIEVPKGHYLPVFRKRMAPSQAQEADFEKSKTDPGAKTTSDGPFSRKLKIGVALAIMVAAAVAVPWR